MRKKDIVAIVAATALLTAGCSQMPTAAQSEKPADLLTVNATASTEVVPDKIIINIGVNERASSAKEAKDNGNAALNSMTDTLLGLGVEEKSIRTSQMSINPWYNYDNNSGEQRLVGYNYDCMLTVSVTDTELANRVIDDGISSGGNALNGVSYEISDETSIYEATLEKAIADARGKAELMAKASGRTLGEVKELIEQNGQYGYTYSYAVNEDTGAGKSASRVMVGTQKVTASATVTFYLK